MRASGLIPKIVLPAAFAWASAFPPNGASAQTLETLYSFCAGNVTPPGLVACTDGNAPGSGVVIDKAGALYGTTYIGGAYGFGTVFKLTPPPMRNGTWTKTILHSFNGNDGAYPFTQTPLIIDTAGTLYGAVGTQAAGVPGTIFKLAPPRTGTTGWALTTLYNFIGGADGSSAGAMILGPYGTLYGTTGDGGVTGNGTVFKLTPPPTRSGTWTKTILHSFTGADGSSAGALILDPYGTLYGTTGGGGADNFGTVFKLTPPVRNGAWTLTSLYNFTGSSNDGGNPFLVLVRDAAGTLYGTSRINPVVGNVFELAPSHARTPAWTISLLAQSLILPSALVIDETGTLYGTTTGVAPSVAGSVFRLAPPPPGQSNGTWTQTTYEFSFTAGGYQPSGTLALDQAGALYGTTQSAAGNIGAATGDSSGTIYKVTFPVCPPNTDVTVSGSPLNTCPAGFYLPAPGHKM